MLMLLLFVCEKLVQLSTTMAEQYRKQVAETGRSLSEKAQRNRSVMVGEYEISSQREWSCLLQALVTLQLQLLDEFLNELVEILPLTLPHSQHARLGLHVQKVTQLRRRMVD